MIWESTLDASNVVNIRLPVRPKPLSGENAVVLHAPMARCLTDQFRDDMLRMLTCWLQRMVSRHLRGGELPPNRCEKPSQMMEEKCLDLYDGLWNRLLKRAALVFFD